MYTGGLDEPKRDGGTICGLDESVRVVRPNSDLVVSGTVPFFSSCVSCDLDESNPNREEEPNAIEVLIFCGFTNPPWAREVLTSGVGSKACG
jgi:hypothetical protein